MYVPKPLRVFLLLSLALRALPQEMVAEPTITAEDRMALLQLYESTNGEHWKNHDGWKGPVGTECHWFGVICGYGPEGLPRVEGLFLEDNNLVGPLPKALDGLADLSELLLFGNRMSGSVPSLTLKRFDE